MLRLRLGISSLAVLATLGAAHAADYSQPLPQPPVYAPPAPVQEVGEGWYLRGFVGAGINANYKLDYMPGAPTDFAFDHQSIADTFFLGGAVGYEWNSWLRFDVSAEYRAKTRVYAFGHYTAFCPSGFCLDTYEGNISSWVFLANAFVDIGTWNCFTPFVGAGVGTARNTLYDFTDINPTVSGFGTGHNPSEWHLAYAFYAGIGYNVTKNFKVDISYRYLNYGSITDTIDCFGSCTHDSYKFDNLYSHDIMLGLRWLCCEVAPPPPPPSYVYVQPPVYTPPPPPPLRSKG